MSRLPSNRFSEDVSHLSSVISQMLNQIRIAIAPDKLKPMKKRLYRRLTRQPSIAGNGKDVRHRQNREDAENEADKGIGAEQSQSGKVARDQ